MKIHLWLIVFIFTGICTSGVTQSFPVNEEFPLRSWKVQTEKAGWILLDGSLNHSIPKQIQTYYSNSENTGTKSVNYKRLIDERKFLAAQEYDVLTNFYLDKNFLTANNAEFILENVQTYCDIFVNNKKVGFCANSFLRYSFNIKKYLKKGANSIRLHFYPSHKFACDHFIQKSSIVFPADNQSDNIKTAPHIRQPQQEFGWDFTIPEQFYGFRTFPKLLFWKEFTIRDFYVRQQQLTSEIVNFTVNIEIESLVEDSVVINLDDYCKPPFGGDTTICLKKGIQTFSFPVQIFHPELWWPRGFRKNEKSEFVESKLYEFQISVKGKNDYAESLTRFGFRTIELIREKDSIGESFYFKINGKPIFIKGTNLVMSQKEDRMNRDEYGISSQEYFSLKEQGVNMIRIWGGGNYLPEAFYDRADEDGILIWQDFMFSGTMYPGDENFLGNVKKEIEFQTKRLRKHPSLSLWCGNNEIDVAWKNWGWQKKYNYSPNQIAELGNNYKKLFLELIPEIIYKNCPEIPYLHSSPVSNWGKEIDFNSGDNHYWGVWHGNDSLYSFAKKVPRFMSEYGVPSLPSMVVIQEHLGTDYSFDKNPELLHEMMRSYKGFHLLIQYIKEWYLQPRTLEELIYLSQCMQAEAYELAIEAHRKNSPRCMGTMYWQFNDAAPAISWSVLDFSYLPKQSWYSVKETYKPVITIVEANRNSIGIRVLSDKPESTKGKLNWRIMHRDGKIIKEGKNEIEIPSNSNQLFATIQLKELKTEYPLQELFVVAQIGTSENETHQDVELLVTPKDFHWKKPEFFIESDSTKFRVSSNTLCMAIFTDPTISGFNNRFDLIPGDTLQFNSFEKHFSNKLNTHFLNEFMLKEN